MRFILNWLLTSVAVAVSAAIVPGIAPFGGADPWVCFLLVGLALSVVDSLVKPLVTIISLGIFQLVVNGFMLELASWLSVNLFGAGISIAGFWSAFVGAIIVSIVGAVLGVLKD